MPRPFPRALALLGAGAMFMEILDATIVATALPAMAGDLGVAPLDAASTITAYLVTLAVLIPISGWAADRFGIRRVFLVAIAVFTVGSAGCALAPGLGWLIAMRVVQAAGGAMMVPVARLAVLRSVDRHDIVRAIAYLTWPALIAPVLAPLLGGLLVTHLGWRAIFAINLPLGVVGFVAAWMICRPDAAPGPSPVRRLDVVGLLLTMVCVGAFMALTHELAAGAPSWWAAAGASAITVIAGVAAVHRMRSASVPLLNPAVLRYPSFASVLGYGTLYRMVISGVPFLLPLMFQLRFGWSATAAGAMVAALFVGNVAIKPLTTPLMRRWGIRRVLIVDGVLSVVGFAALACLGPSTSVVVIALVLVLSGALRSVGFSAYNTLAFSDVDSDVLPDANALHSVAQELGSAAGIALAAVAVSVAAGVTWAPAGGYSVAFALMGALTVVIVWGAWRLTDDAGDGAVGRAPRRD